MTWSLTNYSELTPLYTRTYYSMRLLLNRKEGPTSPRWLSQLPHKALKLEQRLYSASVSLGAYRDRNTLRLRLQTVATSIMQKHLQTKRTKLADDREPKRVVAVSDEAGQPVKQQASNIVWNQSQLTESYSTAGTS
jgi:hypothetical protein